MQLVNEFEVGLRPEDAWTLLTDVERVAPCLPGASITSVEGDEFHGQAKIKVGPITAQYKGVARFTELDESSRRAVLVARGKDARGQGDATATVTAHLNPVQNGTRVTVETDLALTGKVAQFGRGVLADVSGALMGLFAQRLQQMVVEQSGPLAMAAEPAAVPDKDLTPAASNAPAIAPAATFAPAVASRSGGDDDVLDVLALAGSGSWSKLLPAAGTAAVSVAAALISVFAAGYAAARARSIGQ